MRSDKKVIILDNIKSDCIEQAMFILKDGRPENLDAVSEAEKIIENYSRRYRHRLYPRRRARHPFAAAFGVLAGAGMFAAVLHIIGII